MMSKRAALAYQISTLPLSYIPKVEDFFVSVQNVKKPKHKISAFNVPDVVIKEPKLSQWDYLDQEKCEKLLALRNPKDIGDFISSTLRNYPKGRPKELFVTLMSDVVKFCQKNEFEMEKCAAILSQFYQTHVYVTSGVDITAEKVYLYFKDLTMSHTLPFPPSKKKIFDIKESKDILEFFCRMYLRNLPLVKYLCMPNFALYLNYEIPPPPPVLQKGKDKGAKKKGDKDSKKGDKGSKKGGKESKKGKPKDGKKRK